MNYATLQRSIAEAKRFIALAEQVPYHQLPTTINNKTTRVVEVGKQSGAARRASMDLTRTLADLRQGR